MTQKTRGGWCRYCNHRVVNNFKRHMRSCRRRHQNSPVPAAHESISWESRPIETGGAKHLPAERHIEGKVIKTIRIEKDTPNVIPPPPAPSNVSILDMMRHGVRQATISQRLKDLDLE